MRSRGRSRHGFYTNRYDLSQLGTWQLLQAELTVPDHYDALYIAVSTDSKAEQKDVLMYLDDVTIVPTGTPSRDTYVYPASDAKGAELSGGLKLVADSLQRDWQTIVSPNGEPGTARFTIHAPYADSYRLLARAKSPQGAANLAVSIDGTRAGLLPIDRSANYKWIRLTPSAGNEAIQLARGKHTVTVAFPGGKGPAVQKVCLTNEAPLQ